MSHRLLARCFFVAAMAATILATASFMIGNWWLYVINCVLFIASSYGTWFNYKMAKKWERR